jgi:hypothetical protein
MKSRQLGSLFGTAANFCQLVRNKRMRQADRRAVWYFKIDHGNIIYPRSFRKFRRADSPSPEPGVPAGIS